MNQQATVIIPPDKLPVDHKRLKGQVKQMCFDMLLQILREAETNTEPGASVDQS